MIMCLYSCCIRQQHNYFIHITYSYYIHIHLHTHGGHIKNLIRLCSAGYRMSKTLFKSIKFQSTRFRLTNFFSVNKR